jgi:hypothetical protein
MARKTAAARTATPAPTVVGEPFATAQEAWFWFIQSYQARSDGARFGADRGQVARPCEPLDILRILDRLWRQRMLVRDHLFVLRHYGRRLSPPNPDRRREARAYVLWHQALNVLEDALVLKGIVMPRGWDALEPTMERAIA